MYLTLRDAAQILQIPDNPRRVAPPDSLPEDNEAFDRDEAARAEAADRYNDMEWTDER